MSRQLTPHEAEEGLSAGDDHYRAYVGPPGRYGAMTLIQMNLLAAFGLHETDRVLDFGCGSLRLGRSLIPFLQAGNYYGIEPNLWLIEEGLDRETGRDLQTVKSPHFSGDANFDCGVFGVDFDFIMAQSIITHSGPEPTARLFETAAKALKPDGLFLASYIRPKRDEPLTEEEWVYPGCVAYPDDWLEATAAKAGLVWRPIGWHHPGAVWGVAARDEQRLPPHLDRLGRNGKTPKRWRAG